MRLKFAVLCALVVGCSDVAPPESGQADSGSLPRVYTVNYPLQWLAAQIAGDLAEVQFPAPANVDPAFWEPEPEVLQAYQEADLVLLNGAGYAAWLKRVSMPANSQFDSSRAFAAALIELDQGPVHTHGPAGEHSHGEKAFTTWLDLALCAQQAAAVAGALSAVLPTHTAELAVRSDAVQQQLLELDTRLLELGRQLAGAPLLYSHPVYQYLQRRYQLNGRALHWEPDQGLSDQDLAGLDRVLAQHPAGLMLWEDEPLPATVKALADRGISVVVFRPLGNRPASGDFLDGMSGNISALQTYLLSTDRET